MNTLLKLLARLYPSAWQQRYGAEFEALLEDRPPRLRDAFDILLGALKMQIKTWSPLQIIRICTLLGTVIAATISFATPPQYISQTFISVNGSATDPTTPPYDLKPFLSILRASTLDRDFLASLIQKKNLYPRERTRMPLNAVIDKMLDSITLRPLSSSADNDAVVHNAVFILQFAYSDPNIAQQVGTELASHFGNQNLLIATNAATIGHPLPTQTISIVNSTGFQGTPIGWSKTRKTAIGFITGLLSGLILAAIVVMRRSPAIANT
jgi:capsular polysaccharide biosynthesis protein